LKTKFLAMFVGTAVFAIGSPAIAASKYLLPLSLPQREREFVFMGFCLFGFLFISCCFAFLAHRNEAIAPHAPQLFLFVALMLCLAFLALGLG
jgi:drug/metabolite transporter (DMT)-like permease